MNNIWDMDEHARRKAVTVSAALAAREQIRSNRARCYDFTFSTKARLGFPSWSEDLDAPDGVLSVPGLMANHYATQLEERYGVSIAEMKGGRRSRLICACRAWLCFVISKRLGWSLTRIGRYMGHRDHTTILHAIRRFEAGQYNEVLMR